MDTTTQMSPGRVCLVGAGPGDPELLTLRAKRRLEQADVVFFDNRANPAILDFCSPQARRVDVGKIPRGKRTSQAVINALLAKEARQGNRVVRLKGGDPFVFGRGGEEAMYLRERGIAVEVVPGISSCIGVPGAAGIPVTHRGVSTHFSVVTGMSAQQDQAALAHTWRQLAEAGGTLVFLMGVSRLADIVEVLDVGGLAPATPAALVEAGTTAHTRVVEATLATIVAKAARTQVRPPATLVVGGVVGLRQFITNATPHADVDVRANEF